MKNKLMTLAGGLALLSLAGGYYVKPALADPVKATLAALVQNRDEGARNAYQARLNCASAGGLCQIFFPAVPAGKRLVIENVSVLLRGSGVTSGVLDSVAMYGSNTGSVAWLPGVYMQTGGPFVVHQTVSMAFEPGETPVFAAVSSSPSSYAGIVSIFGRTGDFP